MTLTDYVIILVLKNGDKFPVGNAGTQEWAEKQVKELKQEFPNNIYHIYEVKTVRETRRVYPNLGA